MRELLQQNATSLQIRSATFCCVTVNAVDGDQCQSFYCKPFYSTG